MVEARNRAHATVLVTVLVAGDPWRASNSIGVSMPSDAASPIVIERIALGGTTHGSRAARTVAEEEWLRRGNFSRFMA